jgi:uncharacterized protein (DUF433 family)
MASKLAGKERPQAEASVTLALRITKTPGVMGGRSCIAGHRVRVLDIVVWHEQHGWTPDEIVSQIPSITLAEVHAALAYYYDHREEIQEEIRVEREEIEELRRKAPSLLGQKLRQRKLGKSS